MISNSFSTQYLHYLYHKGKNIARRGGGNLEGKLTMFNCNLKEAPGFESGQLREVGSIIVEKVFALT